MDKDNAGPIRRFPAGFWASFNYWWHNEFRKLGQRPSSKAIFRWHVENAQKVWGERAVSYGETQRHANRMKSRKTGLPKADKTCADGYEDEDDDEEYVPDAAELTGTFTRTATASTAAGKAAELPESQPCDMDMDSCCELYADAMAGSLQEGLPASGLQEPLPRSAAAALNANSDPPGALLACLASDSELPAPAAAPSLENFPANAGKRLAGTRRVEIEPNSAWMHPDPVGPTSHSTGPGLPGQGQGRCSGGAAAVASLAWDSTASIFAPPAAADIASAFPSPLVAGGQLAAQAGAGVAGRAGPRGSPEAEGAGAGISDSNTGELAMQLSVQYPQPQQQACHHQQQQGQQQLPQRLQLPAPSPFAEMALAAGAAGAEDLPVARAAAALLRGAAGAPRPSSDAGWLRSAGSELECLMHDLGIQASSSAWQLQAQARPSALASNRPLTLPPPRPKRDLDSLLRAGGGGGGAGGGTGACAASSVMQGASTGCKQQLGGRSSKRLGVWPSSCGWGAPGAEGGGGGGAGGGALNVLSGAEWTASHVADCPRLNAIDCMPLHALL